MAATPRCNTKEAEDDKDKKMHSTKKVLFVDSYGVKKVFKHPTNTWWQYRPTQ